MNAVSEDELKTHQKNIGGKRVTLDALEANIASKQFIIVPGSMLTICVLTLQNGFNVTGESACADPAMFNKEIGERISEDNAKKKIWPLMGYALKQEIYLETNGGTFQDRVIKEQKDLIDKILKLSVFIGGNELFKTLSDAEQTSLNNQLNAMRAYEYFLNERIFRF